MENHPMPYAILRFAKLKTEGAISASGSHMARTRPTHNADPGVKNRLLSGTADPAADAIARLAVATERRKNSVLAIEVMASASPEWFATASAADREAWVQRTQAWLVGEFGPENVCHLQLHLDETTPHITGFIVPVDPASGRLNAARWLDGSARLAGLQTGYADAVSSLGLARGLEGSDATHTTVRQFYGTLAEHEATPPPAAILQVQARQALLAERRAKKFQATGERFRAAAQAARDVPLHEVAEHLGLVRHKIDAEKWVDAGGACAITLTGQKWHDHKAAAGGGGAVDLVKHVMQCDFQQAVSWLGHNVGAEPAAGAVVARAVQTAGPTVKRSMSERPPFQAPAACPDTSPKHEGVRDYLCTKRGLSRLMVDRLMTSGQVYSDERGNAVFKAVGTDGVAKAAERRGTGQQPFQGLASGSNRNFCFEVATRASGQPLELVLTESAIDAMSYTQIARRGDLVVASTAGARPTLPDDLAQRIKSGGFGSVVIAYDADAPGYKAADKLAAFLAKAGLPVTVRQQYPSMGKDWNDELLAMQRAQAPQGAPPVVKSTRRTLFASRPATDPSEAVTGPSGKAPT